LQIYNFITSDDDIMIVTKDLCGWWL